MKRREAEETLRVVRASLFVLVLLTLQAFAGGAPSTYLPGSR